MSFYVTVLFWLTDNVLYLQWPYCSTVLTRDIVETGQTGRQKSDEQETERQANKRD